MKKLKVNLEDLASSFTFDSEGLSREYFDTETGEIIHIPSEVERAVENDETENLPDWEKELVEDAIAVLEDEENRYLLVPVIGSRYFYDAMVDFAEEEITDDKLKEKLANALRGKRPMRNFKDVLHDHSAELDKWYEYEDDKTRQYVLEWLEERGITPEVE